MEEFQINGAMLVIGGCLSTIVLSAFIMLFVVRYQKKVIEHEFEQQKAKLDFQAELLHATIEVEEKERNRIAKNIHDELGVLLSLIKMNMGGLVRNSVMSSADKEKLTNTINIADSAVQSTRSIVRDLLPPTLHEHGFSVALHDLCKLLNESKAISIELHIDDYDMRFPTAVELQLYRISQEIITNIIKHSVASHIAIQLAREQNKLHLLFEHNGKGITDDELANLIKKGQGNGLKNILSRLQLLNATQKLECNAASYRHLITLPLSI